MWVGKVVLIVALLAAACGRASTREAANTPSKSEPKRRAAAVCPLTGEKAPSELPDGLPALGIKIDNAAAARPQAGLERADIVYEELAEGGITRFLAIFHCSEAERVGPVRSARLVDPDILTEYAPALLGYSGANREVLKKVRSTKGIVDLQFATNGGAYQKVKGRPAPHNIFTSTAQLRALSEVSGAPRIGLIFKAASPLPAGKSGASPPASSPSAPPPGAAVSFSFAGPHATRYTYDGIGGYSRWVGDKPFLGEGTSQLRAANVVVLKVKVSQGSTRDAAGNFSPEISVAGSGEAVVLSGGKAVTARWVRESIGQHLRLVNGGKDVTLLPGKTWIHLLPSDRPVTIE